MVPFSVSETPMQATSLFVNGNAVSVAADGDTPLLDVLRNHLGLLGTKFGCGQEQCGCCMVHCSWPQPHCSWPQPNFVPKRPRNSAAAAWCSSTASRRNPAARHCRLSPAKKS